ncbi:MAG: PIG-L family deacetylase [Caldilineaceae bacterium]
MKNFYDAIYLSPHLDDAALSCGGQIFQQSQQGQQILIVTITAGDPPPQGISTYAQSLHTRWELVTDAVAARRAEDRTAAQILGADVAHWDVPDCIYRYHPTTGAPFYLSDPEIFGPVHEAEGPLLERLRVQLTSLPAHEQLYVPLTVGHHVDHQLTRSAAEDAFDSATLLYYEDYPYAQKADAVATVIPPASQRWQAEVIPLTEAAIQVKLAAIAAYASQFSTFFKDYADLERQIRSFTAAVGGERIWRQYATHNT